MENKKLQATIDLLSLCSFLPSPISLESLAKGFELDEMYRKMAEQELEKRKGRNEESPIV